MEEHNERVAEQSGEVRRDATWVVLAQRGDADAFQQLFLAYQRPVYAIALRMMGNAEDAADLTQETFVRAYRQLNHLRAGETFGRWIRVIVTNLCRDHLKRVRPTVYSLDAPPPGMDSLSSWELPSSAPNAEDMLISAEFRTAIAQGLATLSPDFRAVVVLHHIDDQPVEEIGRILKIPIGTVKSRLARARAHLRRYLESYLQTSELSL